MRILSRNFALFCLLSFVPTLPAAASTQYEQGTLVAIEKHTKITPIDYIYDKVVSYYETVTYELEIRVGNETYFTDYTPEVQPNWPLPSEWKPNQVIQFRRDKHRLFVKLRNDEILTFLSRHTRPKSR